VGVGRPTRPAIDPRTKIASEESKTVREQLVGHRRARSNTPETVTCCWIEPNSIRPRKQLSETCKTRVEAFRTVAENRRTGPPRATMIQNENAARRWPTQRERAARSRNMGQNRSTRIANSWQERKISSLCRRENKPKPKTRCGLPNNFANGPRNNSREQPRPVAMAKDNVLKTRTPCGRKAVLRRRGSPSNTRRSSMSKAGETGGRTNRSMRR